MLQGIAWGLGLSPTTVCIQLLNDSHYASPYRDLEHRREVARDFVELGRQLEEHVSKHAADYELFRRPDTYVVVRRDMWRPWDGHLEYYSARDRTARSTLGYGRHAQSTLFGELVYQNQDRTAEFDPSAPIYAARERSYTLECIADIVSALEFSRTIPKAELEARYGAETLAALAPSLDALAQAGHLERRADAIGDLGLSPDAVKWLISEVSQERGTPASDTRAPEEDLEMVRVTEPGCSWSIRIERALPDVKYFQVSSGYGLYYQADPGSEVDGSRAATIMKGVARHVERLAARGVPPRTFPAASPRSSRSGPAASGSTPGPSRPAHAATA